VRSCDPRRILKRIEGKTLELKRDLSSSEAILKCLVAFANTAGGIFVIGEDDGAKNIRSVPGGLLARVTGTIRPPF
jgi:predicted HTH transcriptional regulator